MINQHTSFPEPLDEPMYIIHPDKQAIQSIRIGDMLTTRESTINEHGPMADRVRQELVTSVCTNADGSISSVASIECYPYSEQWVLSDGKCEWHTLNDLDGKVIDIRKRVVPTDLASGDLKKQDIMNQIESYITHRKILESNKYFVYEESMLGYMRPHDSKPAYFAGPQHLFILSGNAGDTHLLDAEKKHLRPATVKDFADYRVSLPTDFHDEQVCPRKDDIDKIDMVISKNRYSPE